MNILHAEKLVQSLEELNGATACVLATEAGLTKHKTDVDVLSPKQIKYAPEISVPAKRKTVDVSSNLQKRTKSAEPNCTPEPKRVPDRQTMVVEYNSQKYDYNEQKQSIDRIITKTLQNPNVKVSFFVCFALHVAKKKTEKCCRNSSYHSCLPLCTPYIWQSGSLSANRIGCAINLNTLRCNCLFHSILSYKN